MHLCQVLFGRHRRVGDVAVLVPTEIGGKRGCRVRVVFSLVALVLAAAVTSDDAFTRATAASLSSPSETLLQG